MAICLGALYHTDLAIASGKMKKFSPVWGKSFQGYFWVFLGTSMYCVKGESEKALHVFLGTDPAIANKIKGLKGSSLYTLYTAID